MERHFSRASATAPFGALFLLWSALKKAPDRLIRGVARYLQNANSKMIGIGTPSNQSKTERLIPIVASYAGEGVF